MELVPIIYNSLFILITFLSVIVFSSLVCSRFSLCDKSNGKRDKNVAVVPAFEKDLLQRKENHKASYSMIKEDAKIRAVTISNIRDTEIKQKSEHHFQQVSRYSVVNANYGTHSLNKGLYEKFSKMSIKYSQSI